MEAAPLLLASASPRRRRLLAWLGVPFDVTVTHTDEDLGSPLASIPTVLARSLAADKARAAADMEPAGGTILAFDTIVVRDRRVLGKPTDRDGAREMLASLSGRDHDVITGVATMTPGAAEPRTFAVSTPVTMSDLGPDRIEEWVAGEEVLGCAGAYNIERHLASVGEGECFQNVAGLPLCHVYQALVTLHSRGVIALDGLESPVRACEEARGVACPLGATLTRG